MNARDILIYLAIKYNGEFNKIYEAILNKEKFEQEDYEQVMAKVDTSNAITLVDDDYPIGLKNVNPLPFVIFYKGNKKLLFKENDNLAVVGSPTYEDKDIQASLARFVKSLGRKKNIVAPLNSGAVNLTLSSAVGSGARVIGVLNEGLDNLVDRNTLKLVDDILKSDGVVISMCMGEVAKSSALSFQRGALISGLCEVGLISDFEKSRRQSLSYNVASSMLNADKEVATFPTGLETSLDNNRYIKQGLSMALEPSDVYELYQDFKKDKDKVNDFIKERVK